MATTKQAKKTKEQPFDGTYFAGVGRRKTAVAQVRVYCEQVRVYCDAKKADFIVNDKKMDAYFMTDAQKDHATEPLKATGMQEKCAVSVVVKGGGLSGQADAVKLGIARALVKYDDGLRPVLKTEGLLTRDARKVERHVMRGKWNEKSRGCAKHVVAHSGQNVRNSFLYNQHTAVFIPAVFFRRLKSKKPQRCVVLCVGVEGFEPPTVGLKGRCSTD